MKQATAGLALTILVALLSVVSLSSSAPPAVVPADAPGERFSAERALEHLRQIARQQRPLGSAEHARVRAYLMDRLRELGAETQIQTATVVRQGWLPWMVAGTVNNVVARLPGQESGPAVLLVAHYDSVPHSPGAADDGAGVAALLETLRAVRQGPQLRNDLIFLLTDGEEVGLFGARAFVEQHPWAADVGVVLNFEARGTEGPSLMFESTRGNRPLMAALDQAVAQAEATSVSDEVYRRMPNDTDFSVLRELGAPGLNFAFIGGESTYHTAQDTIERLDPRSLQHHGEYALQLARRFGNLDLETDLRPDGNSVHFNLLGALVRYPESAVLPLAIVLSLATLALLVFGFRRQRLTVGGLAMATIYNLLATALVAGVMFFLGQWIIGWGYVFSMWNGWSSLSLTLLGFAWLTLAAALVSYRWRAGRQTAEDLIAGGLVVWWLLTLLVSLASPGASYLWALPLIFGLAASWRWLGGEPRVARDGDATIGWPSLLALAALGALVALVWPPLLAVFGTAMGFIAAPVFGLVIFLLVHALLAPHLELDGLRGRGWLLPVASLVLGLVVIVLTQVAAGHGADNRDPSSFFYYQDAEADEAFWASCDPSPHPWVRQFIPDEGQSREPAPPYLFVYGRPPIHRAAAAISGLGDAEVQLMANDPTADGRRLDLQIRWPYEVHLATVMLRSADEIRLVSLGAQALEAGEDYGPGDAASRRSFNYWGPPAEGFRLILDVVGDAPLEVEVVAQRWALPELPGVTSPERPADTMPLLECGADATFIRNQMVFYASSAPVTLEPSEPSEPNESVS